MKTALTIVAVLAFSSAAISDPPKKPADDNDLLAGTWKLTEIELTGNSRAPGPEEKWVIGKGKIEWAGRIRPVTFSYTIDETKTPKQIDLEIVDGALGVGVKLKGIYKLTEGQLQVCYSLDHEKGRPTEFAGTDNLGKSLPGNPVYMILRRAKEKEEK